MVEPAVGKKPKETLYGIIRGWAEETPQAVALVDPARRSITYRELLTYVEATMDSLRALGLEGDARIAVVLPNSTEAAALVLAICCAASSVPINPLLSENEWETLLSSVGVQAVLVASDQGSPAVAAAKRHQVRVIEAVASSRGNLPELISAGRRPAPSRDPVSAGPDAIALVLQTSGTTATPKRVPLTQRNLCTSAYSIAESLALTPLDRCLGIMPLFHIHGLVGTLLSSLAAGGSFLAAPPSASERWCQWMAQFLTTWYSAVPTLHYAVLSRARESCEVWNQLPLRLIRSASAPLPLSLRLELENTFRVPVIEAYGMTEAAHQIASNPLPPQDRKPGSVGLPRGTEVAIMDQAGRFMAAGESGEVVIRGPNVMSGYEPREANEERFVNGWLRTGDLGYFDNDGYLFLTARLKEIVNRGGEKILPREIEDALLEHPDVLQAVAFAIPHCTLGEDSAAAVVLRPGNGATEAGLRAHLIGRLAGFKVPTRLWIVDKIPTGATGKVQRSTLAQAFAARLETPFVPPRDALEELIANIYADVLKVLPVSVCDNFFTLGGDSLRATQVISRLRSLLSVNLPIATVFSNSSVRQLAEAVAACIGSRRAH